MDIKNRLGKMKPNGKKGKEPVENEKRNYFKLDNPEEEAPRNSKKASQKESEPSGERASGRRTKRKKMSRKEKKMRIALNWIVFVLAVALIIFIVIKLVTGAVHLLTGSSSKEEIVVEQTAAEATTEYVEEEKSNEPVQITISAIGDCVLGTDERFGYEGGFTEKYDSVDDPGYFFELVKPVLEQDDLTIANLEVALTKSLNMSDNEYNFKGEPEYAKILAKGSVEAANLANSHTHDYGEDGYNDTVEFTEQAGVKTFGNDKTAIIGVKGVKVGLIGINVPDDSLDAYKEQVQTDISNLRLEGAQIVIASFHWGIEQESATTEMQRALGHAAIDAGADLVLGHHPHVLQGIEEYNGKNIVYSLANFVYGANSSPEVYGTMIYQQTFTVTGDQVSPELVTKVIPCRISSSEETNNFQPKVAEGEDETIIMDRITQLSQELKDLASESSGEENAEGSEESEESYSEENAEDSEESYDEENSEGSDESGDGEESEESQSEEY